MDYGFAPAVRAKIKTVRAHAFGLGIAEGQDAATASRSADAITRQYWRDRLRHLEDRKHIKARTLRRILTREGVIS